MTQRKFAPASAVFLACFWLTLANPTPVAGAAAEKSATAESGGTSAAGKDSPASFSALPRSPQSSSAAGSGGWDVVFAPYLWASTGQGRITIRGRSSDVEFGLPDLLPGLEIGFTGRLEARNDKVAIFTDISYFGLGAANENVDVDLNMTTLEFGAGYRVNPVLTVFGGTRYYNINADLIPKNSSIPTVGGGADWWDPMIGVRVGGNLTKKLSAFVSGDIGGFGVGSDVAWSFSTGIDYRLLRKLSLQLGYKVLDIDYATGSGPTLFEYDIRYTGPIVAFAFHF